MVSFDKKWLLLVLSTILLACNSMREEIVPQALAGQSDKLVVDCFISPQDTLLTAKVTRSRPVLDNDATRRVEVSDAVVTLSDGSNSVRLVYNSQLALYAVKAQKMVVRSGNTYQLTVRYSTGQQVSATTTVPSMIALDAIQLDSAVASGQVNGEKKEYRLVGSWQDPANAYYRVKGTVRGIPINAPSNSSYGNPEAMSFIMATNSLGLLASQNKAGTLSASALLDKDRLSRQYRSMAINVDLMHVDEAYYQYHVALDQQLKAANNPFAEPVIIPTNIQNGLGCFGSYNQSRKTVTLK
ncbi:DUF4249 domain-containing protein [Spirosoma oryzicola]|uniref:DUF4249 domain-containing protein n=1 Tax=Spirosoma oryzicola TaxID=2898794 RepID=UPI001E50F960|nr:DUF4249 domain-containing protein [Spirosoma oryzicola]UHG92232.1 DUF4249 domain-containing protein [Spirosoma oryzicola]